jgi:DNA invertase Pin-like site-specific DNA recombinase
MLGVFAEFETNLRRERQAEGIASAKLRGVYTGGKPRIDRSRVHALAAHGHGPSHIAHELGISRRHVYRLLEERPQSLSVSGG